MKKNPPKATGIPSPCISVCTMDEATGFCAGCYRTLKEIERWKSYSDPVKKEILEKLQERRTTNPNHSRP